jgi:CBS domain-containing protein
MAPVETIQATQGQAQDIIAVSQYERIIDAAKIMHEHRIGCLVVAVSRDDETMVGIITERDILGWISNASPDTYFQQVREIMTENVISCQTGASVSDTLELMKQHHMRHIPIVENGKAVGMLSVRDLLERHFHSPSE